MPIRRSPAVGTRRRDELLIDGIAAQVGNDIVLVSEVMQRVGPLEARLREADAPGIEIAKLRAAGLEKLIEARLVEQIVRRAELYASDDEIDQAIDSIARENGITREQLEQSVVAQGLTFERYRSQLKKEIESRKVIGAMVASKVHVEEDEVRALYDERFSDQPEGGEVVHLRQILDHAWAVWSPGTRNRQPVPRRSRSPRSHSRRRSLREGRRRSFGGSAGAGRRHRLAPQRLRRELDVRGRGSRSRPAKPAT